VAELKRQGFEDERMLNMRFEGMDTALMELCEGNEVETEDFEAAFKTEYKEFGFLLESKIVVDDVKVRHRVHCAY
jgi:5-oxoprolinase (ATP-hydrolysing)